MNCPKCLKGKTKCVDSRSNKKGSQTRRRRACMICKFRFSTFERRNDSSLERQLKVAIHSLHLVSAEKDEDGTQTIGASIANNAILKIMRAKITRAGMKVNS